MKVYWMLSPFLIAVTLVVGESSAHARVHLVQSSDVRIEVVSYRGSPGATKSVKIFDGNALLIEEKCTASEAGSRAQDLEYALHSIYYTNHYHNEAARIRVVTQPVPFLWVAGCGSTVFEPTSPQNR